MKEWIIFDENNIVINIAWLDVLSIDDNFEIQTRGMNSMRTKMEGELVELGWKYNVELDEFQPQ